MTKDLTKGGISKALLLFSLPMILGNMLQQLYNVADTLIVGKILGATALSAVGSSYALMVLLTSIILGFCMGSSVVFAQLYGAKQYDKLKLSIVNALAVVVAVTALINIASFLLLNNFIKWINVPEEAAAYTKEYLQVIFTGIAAVTVYNFFAAVLRSVGNTVVPLIFLAVSAVLNIVLDLVFIINFKMGVAGAAWATVIAQIVSAVCIAFYFFAKAKELCPQKRHFRIDIQLLKFITSNSALTAVQQSIMNFGILMVQGLVNSFGFYASAAFAAVVKIDAFAYMPAQDFGNAFATFVAQNHGAQKRERIRNGTKSAFIISAVFCVIASVAVCLFARPLMLLFVNANETEIINIGMQYLFLEGSCYVGIGILFLLYGYYRGLGRPVMSVVLTVVSLGSRVALAYWLSSYKAFGMAGIWLAIPIGWALADIIGILFMMLNKKRTRL